MERVSEGSQIIPRFNFSVSQFLSVIPDFRKS